MRDHREHASLKKPRQHPCVVKVLLAIAAQFSEQRTLVRSISLCIIDPFLFHRSTLTRPRLIAVVAADVRSETPILPKMFWTCDLTVFSEMSRAKAISLLDIPPTIILNTFDSVRVSSSLPKFS